MTGFNFTFLELAFLLPSALGAIGIVVWGWSSHQFWSPITFFSALVLYYLVGGPLLFAMQGRTDFLGVDYRPLYWLGWLASLVAFASFCLGYAIPVASRPPSTVLAKKQQLTKIAFGLLLVSVVALVAWAADAGKLGSFLRPVAVEQASAMEEEQSVSAIVSYLLYTGNLIIPALVLLLVLWLRYRNWVFLSVFVGAFVFAMAFYLNTGFRFRIAWTVVALVSACYLQRRARPNPLLLAGGAAVFLMGMGLIGLTRNYFGGLSLDRAAGVSGAELLESGFTEAGIFTSVCAVFEAVPARLPHTYFDPLVVTAAFPIPRRLWPNKPQSRTLEVLAGSFESPHAAQAGQAVPYFGEWYIAFNWPGCIGASMLLGTLYRRLWVWYTSIQHDALVITIYAVSLGFLFFVFSRGYFPAIFMNFGFTILPLLIIIRKITSRSGPAAALRDPRHGRYRLKQDGPAVAQFTP